MKRWFYLALIPVIALMALASAQGVHAQQVSTADADAAFKKAFLSGNLDTLMGVYDDNAVELAPFGSFKGKADIRAGTKGFIDASPGLSVVFGDSVTELNTSMHYLTVTSDPIKATGASRILILHTIVFNAQGKILSLTAVLVPSDPETARYIAASAAH